ncbi:hypothetical protein [Kozakia baliensis]|uniref:hypothetical protein n=1 Tax=Kozakia baliensis TaxID=153496 RepID=UPI0004971B48|nr:hypothetical protein [Kozakia baliensis]
MKLMNLRVHDPSYAAGGLKAGNRLEKEVWADFGNDSALLQKVAHTIRAQIGPEGMKEATAFQINLDDEEGEEPCIHQPPVQLLPDCLKSGITKPQGIFMRACLERFKDVFSDSRPGTKHLASILPAVFRDDEADIIESIPVSQISHIHAAFYQRRQDRAIASR